MTDKNVGQEACPELKDLKALADFFAKKEVTPDFAEKIEAYLVTANKVNEGLKEYTENSEKLREISDHFNRLQNRIKGVESDRKFKVSVAQEKFYLESLKPNLEKLSSKLAEFAPKFADDENLKANFEGIELILKAFENNLISLGLHVKEEKGEE
ncbi:hypothetical protein CJP74_02260 [Psittacicella melopsittaci]|uniref:Uncharacterized protein n=1 Tax=Psittacicella melopsittaci TaxID=2028576 RepID=A0A3A1Y6Y5_9GAMM|nr:hypothetical protein [Psittacicella melopsittaci]RIY33271.1 hypothetical protein CJP74_02260 [Psittacicella melopsittaci]